MSIGNLILGVNSATVKYLILYDSLLQNDTKMRQLLQNATRITNCDGTFLKSFLFIVIPFSPDDYIQLF